MSKEIAIDFLKRKNFLSNVGALACLFPNEFLIDFFKGLGCRVILENLFFRIPGISEEFLNYFFYLKALLKESLEGVSISASLLHM